MFNRILVQPKKGVIKPLEIATSVKLKHSVVMQKHLEMSFGFTKENLQMSICFPECCQTWQFNCNTTQSHKKCYQNSQIVKANAKPSSNDGIADSVAAKHTALDGSLDVLSPMIVLWRKGSCLSFSMFRMEHIVGNLEALVLVSSLFRSCDINWYFIIPEWHVVSSCRN